MTVDGDSLKDDTVTIRDRDSLKQWRVATKDLISELTERLQ
ncbi:MAG: His/Gly/Thr/Pro-type tRNA ligase C-terminal domain-containing protein [Pirellulaceae bacterium]